MKNLYTLLIAIFVVIGAMGQSCLPDGIYFTTQSEIDNFKANYPGCTEIEGNVEIEGSGITNLDSLHQIISIGGYLEIYDVPDLVSISGLSSLSSIETGRLAIFTSGLESLDGLENLETVPGLNLSENPVLSGLQGLSSLTSSAGGVYIVGNSALVNLNGLENLSYVGEGGDLYITDNESLTSLSGIDNIVFNPFYVTNIWIHQNPLLSECDVASICNLINDNGNPSIGENAQGCNSKAEVGAACETSVEEHDPTGNFSVFPNPASSRLTIEVNNKYSLEFCYTLFNSNGQVVLSSCIKETTKEIDINQLLSGIYIIKVWDEKAVMVRKVIKQ